MMVAHRLRWGPSEYVLHGLPGDYVTEQAGSRGTFYEPDLLAYVHVKGLEGTYVDVGAHVGNHSLFFAAECPSTRVVSIEPNDRVIDLLLKNTQDFAVPVTVWPVVVHDTWRTAGLIDIVRGNAGMARAVEGGDVQVCTLDRILASDDAVVVIKVDVEGEEPAVLRSGAETIKRCLPLIAAEVNSLACLGEIEALLLPLGYERTGEFGPGLTITWEVPRGDV